MWCRMRIASLRLRINGCGAKTASCARVPVCQRPYWALRTQQLCQVMVVGPCGLRAICRRPASRRQHTERVVLAHTKEQSGLSLCSYALPGRRLPCFAVRGRPRMTEELREVGVDVGHPLPGR